MTLNDIKDYNYKQQQLYAAKTGLIVEIQEIGKNKKNLALPIKATVEEIHKGVWLSSDTMNLEGGGFTNIYNLTWSQDDQSLCASIHSEKKPYYLMDYVEGDFSILAVMNGSFFFMVDEKCKEPKDFPYHFCVRNGKVVGLLSGNEPILYTVDQKIYAKEPKARGEIKINNYSFKWIGSNNNKMRNISKSQAILYNSASVKIIKTYDPKTGVRQGFLDKKNIRTPRNKLAVDIVVNADSNGILKVSNIKKGGNTHFFDGLFILQILSGDEKYAVGEEVTPLTLDGLDLQKISSGITINKSVRDPYFFVEERIDSRDARSVIAKDTKGNMHFIVFDGSKYIPGFNGVSANDVKDYFSEDRYEWAYFLDGGSSSRIIVRENDELKFFANELTFKKLSKDVFLWDWKKHRRLASSITLKLNTNS